MRKTGRDSLRHCSSSRLDKICSVMYFLLNSPKSQVSPPNCPMDFHHKVIFLPLPSQHSWNALVKSYLTKLLWAGVGLSPVYEAQSPACGGFGEGIGLNEVMSLKMGWCYPEKRRPDSPFSSPWKDRTGRQSPTSQEESLRQDLTMACLVSGFQIADQGKDKLCCWAASLWKFDLEHSLGYGYS